MTTNLVKSAVLVGASLLTGSAFAAGPCETEIEANDAMQFSKSTIQVPASCKSFTVALKHTGKLPKAAMGHNWVLSKAADAQGVAADGIPAGLDKHYVKSGMCASWRTPRSSAGASAIRSASMSASWRRAKPMPGSARFRDTL